MQGTALQHIPKETGNVYADSIGTSAWYVFYGLVTTSILRTGFVLSLAHFCPSLCAGKVQELPRMPIFALVAMVAREGDSNYVVPSNRSFESLRPLLFPLILLRRVSIKRAHSPPASPGSMNLASAFCVTERKGVGTLSYSDSKFE